MCLDMPLSFAQITILDPRHNDVHWAFTIQLLSDVIQAEILCALPDPPFSFSVRVIIIYLYMHCFAIRPKIPLILSLTLMLNWKPSLFIAEFYRRRGHSGKGTQRPCFLTRERLFHVPPSTIIWPLFLLRLTFVCVVGVMRVSQNNEKHEVNVMVRIWFTSLQGNHEVNWSSQAFGPYTGASKYNYHNQSFVILHFMLLSNPRCFKWFPWTKNFQRQHTIVTWSAFWQRTLWQQIVWRYRRRLNTSIHVKLPGNQKADGALALYKMPSGSCVQAILTHRLRH